MNKLLRSLAIPALFFVQLAADAEQVHTKAGMLNVETLARLDQPWGMAFLPDGRLLITEKPGRLRIYADGKLSEPIGSVPEVEFRGQGGLLDVAIDPGFASNALVYLSYTERAQQQPANARDEGDPRLGPFQSKDDNVLKGAAVARGKLDGNQLRNVTVIWRQVPKTIGRGHFGGRMAFGADGKLFITSGDRQRFEPAQDLGTNLGKTVRINADGSIPKDNPFADRPGARPDIWSVGHRNPLGAAIDPATKQLWIHEMGPWHGDELNRIEPGKNYGWPVVSNGDHYNGSPIPKHATRPQFAAPFYYWYPAVSPSGLIIYTGERYKDWKGNMLLGGLSAETLVRLKLEGDHVAAEERMCVNRRIRDVIQAPDGTVLLLSDGAKGELLRLAPATNPTGQ